MGNIKRKAWFLDRDGTIIADMHYIKDPDKVVLLDGVSETLRKAQDMGYLLIVVTNQSGIARGYFSDKEADQVDERLKLLLEQQGVCLTKTYRCPHHPKGRPPYNIVCDCRKPCTGLFHRAIADYDLNPEECIACGDKPRDIQRLPELGIPKEHLGIIDFTGSPGTFLSLSSFFHAIVGK